MSRIHNFSAGPAVLPESVLRAAREDIWNYGDTGVGILEMSHRSVDFQAIIDHARARLSHLLGLGDEHEVLFLHGGARTQFYTIPLNLLREGRATYLDTGTWAAQAADEARRYGTIDIPWSSADTGWDRVPRPGEWGPLPRGTVYLHYTSNNTVAGTEYSYVPEVGDARLVCDASSNILSAPIDGSRFDLLYAGAQKNMGPAGVTLVIIRKSLLDECDPKIPTMCRYGVHAKKGSLYNTPCTFAIYMVDRVIQWIEEQGGLQAIAVRNRRRARSLYEIIDRTGFWQGKVDANSRSVMNVTFTTGDRSVDAKFIASAAREGLMGLKGHRLVGGLRASLYNGQTDAAVQALIDFMRDFEDRRG